MNKNKTNLICPISGGILYSEKEDRNIRDASTFYVSDLGKNIVFERHPFSWSIFRQISGVNRYYGGNVLSWWRLNDDGSWTSMIKVKDTDILLPFDTTTEEINRVRDEELYKRKESQRLYKEALERGEITPLLSTFKEIFTKSINFNLVSVKPMNGPTGKIFYTQPIKI